MAEHDSQNYELIDQLAEDFAARYRRGERPALQEYIDRHPDLADEIRELLPAMVEVEQAKQDFQEPAEPKPVESPAPLESLGDYRIVREIGRGGMGVVYEAEQVSLGRHVALKVLPHHVAKDSKALERFRREARAAARLHHTNIVPVFEVGQHADVCYYAMQFIQGQGLDEVLLELEHMRREKSRASDKSPEEIAAALRVDQRQRWRRGERPLVEAYFQAHPAVREHAEAAIDLIYGEFLLREERGETVVVDEYLERFPEFAGVLRNQLELHRAMVRTDATADAHGVEKGTGPSCRNGPEGASHKLDLSPFPLPSRPISLTASVAQSLLTGQFSATDSGEVASLNATRMISGDAEPLAAGKALGESTSQCLGIGLRTDTLECGDLSPLSSPAEHQPTEDQLPHSMHGTHRRESGDKSPHSKVTSTLSAVLPGGSELSTVSESNPQVYYRSIARIGVQVADALDYAHNRNVIHRDIKPSNLLLDTAGTVWVTDFGLAKTDGDDLTNTGDLIGTLRYMAPERFRGESDPRSDIYGLGVTLYELVTLKPAFDSPDRMRLIQQVTHTEPPRPRKRDPRIPRDLETIILKAIDKDPRQRYSGAGHLADDLRRFLTDRPITARRSSVWEQTWRWCRRNPVVAAPLASVFLLLTVVAIGGMIMSLRLKHALVETDQALKLLREERDRVLVAELARDTEATKSVKMWQLLVDRATEQVASRGVGQRVEALKEIKQAAAIQVTPKLCGLAAAALIGPDFELVKEWEGWRDDTQDVTFDASFQKLVRSDQAGGFEVCRLTEDGEEVLRRLPAVKGDHISAHWLSPNGRFLAYLRNRTTGASNQWAFCVRDLESDEDRLLVQDEEVRGNGVGIGFHPESTEVAVTYRDSAVRRFSLPEGERLSRWENEGNTHHPAYDPSGARVAVPFGNRVHVYETKSGAVLTTFAIPGFAWCLSWTPDGKALAASIDGRIHVFDPVTGLQLMRAWNSNIRHFNYSPDGDRVFTDDGTLWDANTGQPLMRMSEPCVTWGLTPTKFTGLGTRLGRSKLRLWRLHSDNEFRTLKRRWALPNEQITTAGPDDSGRLLATQCQPDAGFAFFDLLTGEQVAYAAPRAAAFSKNIAPDHGWFLTDNDGLHHWPLTWPAVRGEPVKIGPVQPVGRLMPQDHEHSGAGVTRDGTLSAVALEPGRIRLLETATGRLIAEIAGRDPEFYVPLHFTPDGSKLIAGNASRSALYLWDLRKIRTQLKALNLDWDWPEFPPDLTPTGLIRVELVGEEKVDAVGQPDQFELADPRALNNLAWTLAAGPADSRDAARALRLILKATQQEPDNSLYINTLGVVQYRNGMYTEAVTTLEKSLAASKGDADAFDLFFLAMCHAKLGDPAKAKDCFDRAVKWAEQQHTLPAQYATELQQFRAEAEEVLRKE